MKKYYFVPSIIVIYLICSVVCFYSYTLLASNICNFIAPGTIKYVLVSFASIFIAFSLIAGMFLFVRVYKYPQFRKQIALHYLKLIFVFTTLGLICSIAGPLIVYGTILGDQPFPGYGLICLIINALVAYISFIAFCLIKQYLPDDQEKRTTTVRYRLICVFFAIFIFHASNRLGALILSPMYVLGRNLDKTIFFYIYLTISTLFLEIYIADLIDLYKKHPLAHLINVIVIICLNVLMLLLVVIIGYGNSEFISSISTALPLERLIAFPVELLLQFVISSIMSINLLIKAIKVYKQSKKII